MKLPELEPVFIVFDGPPGPKAPGFIEVETSAGFSVNAGEWKPYGNYWTLGPLVTLSAANAAIQAAYGQGKKDAVSKELSESVARAIYMQWRDLPGYLPWQDGGNSLIQDSARRIADLAIEAGTTKQEKNDEPV